MRLIGLLDSPFVRRVAVSLNLLELPYEREALSVYRNSEAFAAINPVIKAPTLIADNGTVLLESTLILDWLDTLVPPEKRLNPADSGELLVAQRYVGLALAACEKTTQIVLEGRLRPEEKRHQPWIDRVQAQLQAAYRLLEADIGERDSWLLGDRPLQADITAAVAWRFTQGSLPGVVPIETHPALARLSRRAEALAAFQAAPVG